MAVTDFFRGTPGRREQYPTVTPGQRADLDEARQMAMSRLRESQDGFAPIEKAARTKFHQQTVPSLAERFTSMGGSPTRSGSFRSVLGQAGAGLEENLAALQSQYGLQQRGQDQNLLGMGMAPQFGTDYRERSPGIAELAGMGALQGGPMALMAYILSRGNQGQQQPMGQLGLPQQGEPQQQQPMDQLGLQQPEWQGGARGTELMQAGPQQLEAYKQQPADQFGSQRPEWSQQLLSSGGNIATAAAQGGAPSATMATVLELIKYILQRGT